MINKQKAVQIINSIKKRYPKLRQQAKAPNFALTYQGTYHTLMQNCGFTEQEALSIEKSHHELYQTSDNWVAHELYKASKIGYVELAFGGRLRTPILQQCIQNTRSTPQAAKAESRTAGNALGQSYGLLNNRATNAFMELVWASEHRHQILPVAQIHDASYYYIPNKIGVLHFINKHLPKEMSWQELDPIKHDQVKLSGSLEVFYPNWNTSIQLDKNCTIQELKSQCNPEINE